MQKFNGARRTWIHSLTLARRQTLDKTEQLEKAIDMHLEQCDAVCGSHPGADRMFHRQADGIAQRARLGLELEENE